MLMLADAAAEVTATWSTETWMGVIGVVVFVNGILITHSFFLRGIRGELKQLRLAMIAMANNPKDGKRALSHLAGSLASSDCGEAD